MGFTMGFICGIVAVLIFTVVTSITGGYTDKGED